MTSQISEALNAAALRWQSGSIAAAFDTDPHRLSELTLQAAGIHLDFSKQRIDRAVVDALLSVHNASDLNRAFEQLVNGATLNITERRAAWHTLLRGTAKARHQDSYGAVAETLARMETLVRDVHSGALRGSQDTPLTDVVNIGIGGSDLGPRMVCQALHHPDAPLTAHFVANVDPHDLDRVLAPLEPRQTLFVVCSKTFTTEETLTNALRARAWLIAHGIAESEVHRHVVAVTSNVNAAVEFGIDREQCYPLWDWVGGRYSLWSAIGLVIGLSLGWEVFTDLLEGAATMDRHTLEAPPEANMPLMMALLELWNTHHLHCESHAVLPYSQRLNALPDFLQQLTMESNGKRVTLSGATLEQPSAPILWGSAGTIGQHSYYQLLHQGNRRFSADIILPLSAEGVDLDAQRKLAANALAQSRALMIGRSANEAQALATERGQPALAPHYEMPGNHPHSLILLDAVSAHNLGALIAAYEHKTFFLSQLLDINAFDQWGVELGKTIGRQIRSALESGEGLDTLDPSTAAAAQAWRDANP